MYIRGDKVTGLAGDVHHRRSRRGFVTNSVIAQKSRRMQPKDGSKQSGLGKSSSIVKNEAKREARGTVVRRYEASGIGEAIRPPSGEKDRQ